jgi:UDP-N-acetyl-D-galactosamine dehydrogenase
LPIIIEFGKKYECLGFDIDEGRIEELKKGIDKTGEVNEELKDTSVIFTSDACLLKRCDVVVVAVPTPIDNHNIPNLEPLKHASKIVGENVKKGAIVVYESTVYPGVTNLICKPIIEQASKGSNFKIAYSPERINPGDKEHHFSDIVKIVSAEDKETLDVIASLYKSVVKAGVYETSSIEVAEAAKVIENTQRDLNIALMNELSIIFHRLGLDTREVLEASATKWNFLKFSPGLVGGHCIGVDPYYLTYKAEETGYHPEVILAGRRVNDYMFNFVASNIVKLLIKQNIPVNKAKLAIFGLTFKENVTDLRNTQVYNLVEELSSYGVEVYLHDPLANKKEVYDIFHRYLCCFDDFDELDGFCICVKHESYVHLDIEKLKKCCRVDKPLFIDIKGMFNKEDIQKKDFLYWRL